MPWAVAGLLWYENKKAFNGWPWRAQTQALLVASCCSRFYRWQWIWESIFLYGICLAHVDKPTLLWCTGKTLSCNRFVLYLFLSHFFPCFFLCFMVPFTLFMSINVISLSVCLQPLSSHATGKANSTTPLQGCWLLQTNRETGMDILIDSVTNIQM